MENVHKEALAMAESRFAMYQNSVNALEGWFGNFPTGTHYDDTLADNRKCLEEYKKEACMYEYIVEVLKYKE